MNNMPLETFLLMFIPIMIVSTILFGYIMAEMGGWKRLSKSYPCPEDVRGTTWRFQTASLGGVAGYGGCMMITANDEGLRLSTIPYVIPFHPPLFIPWEELKFVRNKIFFLTRVTLLFAAHPDLPMTISNRLANKIQSATGQTWFAETPQPMGQE